MKKFKILIPLIVFAFSMTVSNVFAQETPQLNSFRGEIIDLTYETINNLGNVRDVNVYSVRLENNEIVKVYGITQPEIQSIEFSVGDRVIVDATSFNNEVTYTITDYQRLDILIILFSIFVILVVIIGRKQGFFSLIGLAISFLLIFEVLIKQLLNGVNALVSAILISLIIIPFNYYLSHGWSKKTTYAAISTVITLIIVAVLSIIFVEAANLTGYTTDEAGYIASLSKGVINLQQLLLAGIIIGTLGVLDDITISQASIANQLKLTKPNISFKELFLRTITVGKDHIASLVNTLILVYTSASLPLLLIFARSNTDFLTTLNREVIMEEVVVMLLSSIGLILAVPITSYISCYFISKFGADKHSSDHEHYH